MPNCENLMLVGKGGAFVFCPPKSLGIFRWRTPDGNYAVPGGADIQQQARGVTPASDVTGQAKVKNNTGIVAAAGVVPGARLGRPGDSNAVARERGLSRSGRFRPANRLQGSGLFVRMLTGGAGHVLFPMRNRSRAMAESYRRRKRRASGSRGDDERADGHI